MLADDTKEGAMPKDDEDATSDEELGANGVKALEAERDARRAAEKRAEKLEGDLKKITDERDSEAKRASKAELDLARLDIAVEKGLSKTQAKRLVGESREELEADADELIADLGLGADDREDDDEDGAKPNLDSDPDDDDEDADDDDEDADEDEERPTSDKRRRPNERLKPGASPDDDGSEDPAKIAEQALGASLI